MLVWSVLLSVRLTIRTQTMADNVARDLDRKILYLAWQKRY